MPRNRVELLTELKPNNFKPLKGNFKDKIQIAYDNMWGMFDIENHKRSADVIIKMLSGHKPFSMNDFAWTPEVEQAFHEHPFHKGFLEEIKDNDAIFYWEMQSPMVTTKEGEYISE